jgi:SAM-dependent methyltransferase
MDSSQRPEPAASGSDSPAPGTGAYTAATGRQLEQRGDQKNYKRYQYNLIAPHCGPEMLEVGAGNGDFSAQFTDRRRLVVTDVDPDAVAAMGRRFADRPQVHAQVLDLAALTVEQADELAAAQGLLDTVLAINVLEHVEDHVTALQALSRLVRPGGTVVMWVPGYQQLYGDFDRAVGHVRRYTPVTLAAAAGEAGLDVEVCRPVNLLGGIAWWAAVRKGGTGSPKPALVKIYDTAVVPVTRILDKTPIPFGQTVLGVFTRRE